MSEHTDKPLRRGWTTGACATAAASAAFSALLTRTFRDPVEIILPNGLVPRFPLSRAKLCGDGCAEAGVIKDAGDDPDVTHGLEIVAQVRQASPGTGVLFLGGEGVGTVTRPGLPILPGNPAINPGPRAMLLRSLESIATLHGVALDLEVEISVPGGKEAATKTMNERLGILGGLSILGTSGVVIPYSCSAWVASLHRAVDVARASGIDHLVATTGKTSEAGVRRLREFPDIALVDMGDFAGGLLKYLRRHPVRRLTLAGGFAKMAKLAAGNGDLHSSRSHLDLGWLTGLLLSVGASPEQHGRARSCETAMALLDFAQEMRLPLADEVARRAKAEAERFSDHRVDIEVLIFDRSGVLKGEAH